jgi:ribosomal-protein-alanine N-acetyltransferase
MSAMETNAREPGRTLETERLILRPFQDSDIEAYAAIRAKPEVVQYLPGGEARAGQAKEVARQIVPAFAALWSQAPGYGPWAVLTKNDGRLRGHLGLRLLTDLDDETEILYMLDSDVWGQGLATEGAIAARDYAFQVLNLQYIIAMALPQNTASMRIMEKIGMERVPGLVEAFGLKVVRYILRTELFS